MKFLNKKAQGAMEYLMTYGWAILVVMIVGVVLWQLGIFGGGPGAVNTASGFAKIRVLEPSIKYTGTTVTFDVVNGVGMVISNLDTTPAGDCVSADKSISASNPAAGETVQVTLGVGFVQCSSKSPGQSFTVPLTFTYNQTVAGTLVSHTDTGTIMGTAE